MTHSFIGHMALAALVFLCLGHAHPARAIEVTYEYTLDLVRIRDAAAASPFTLSDNVQMSGTFTLDTETADAAAGLDLGSYNDGILNSAFSFSWDEGSYASDVTADGAYRAAIRNANRGAARPANAAQDLFLFQDRSEHAGLGGYAFDRFTLRFEDDDVFPDDGLPAQMDLDDFDDAIFVLRFVDENSVIAYAGRVTGLEQIAASTGPDLPAAAVPLPSSLWAMLATFGLYTLFLRRRNGHGAGECRRPFPKHSERAGSAA